MILTVIRNGNQTRHYRTLLADASCDNKYEHEGTSSIVMLFIGLDGKTPARGLNLSGSNELWIRQENVAMKNLFLGSLALGFVAMSSINPASAGCVTGAIVGGLAGHMVGHGGVGAAAGCAYGAHKSHQAKANQTSTGLSSSQSSNSNPSNQ